MSANDPTNDSRRHERLCAYLFGELDAAERAAVEAELAASAELRAERDQLEATISLVRDAVPASEALSTSARDALSAAAQRREGGGSALAPIHPWPVRVARSPLTAAAAVVLVLGVLAGIAQQQVGVAPGRDSDAVARMDHESTSSLPAEKLAAGHRGYVEPEAKEQGEADDDAPGAGFLSDAAADRSLVGDALHGEAPAEVPALLESEFGSNESVAFDKSADAPQPDPAQSATPLTTWSATTPLPETNKLSLGELGYAEDGGDIGVRDEFLGVLLFEEAVKDHTAGVSPTVQTLRVKPTAPGAGGGGPESKVSAGTELLERARQSQASLSQTASASGPASPGPSGAPLAEGKHGSLDTYYQLGAPTREQGFASLNEMLAVRVEDADGGLADRRRASGRGEDAKLRAGLDGIQGDAVFGRTAAGTAITADDVVRFCRIRPNETPSAMFFRCWGDNPFELTALDALSTFAADVDTASYALARNYLSRGLMPTKEQIRTEEFINAFDSGVPAPVRDVFDVDLEMAPSLFGSRGEWMLRVVVRGKEIEKLERPPLALTFVVDVSGSMKQENRIELVKHALRLLVGELDQNDAIAIVAFSNEARLILPMTSAANKAIIESAIFGLNPDGGTNAEAGLMMGYAQAATALTPGAANRVVLLSDGVANVGNVDEGTLLGNVQLQRDKGIYLNTIGVGMGNHNDALLEQLANKGDGICNYIDTAAEAKTALVDNFTGQFVPIARDVKIQVEFDPAQVESYRLLGYENRAIADAQFRDDAVDAGEVGAGHQVTALYELVRAPNATNDGPLATARVRYKAPFAVDSAKLDQASADAAEVASEIQKAIEFRQVTTHFQGATVGYQRAVLVAQFAEFLRRSVHARGDSYDQLTTEAIRLEKLAEDPAFTEFTTMLARHRDLIVRHLPGSDVVLAAIDELTRRNYLQGKLAQLQTQESLLTAEVLETLQNQNADIERQILELLQQQLRHEQR